MWIDSGHGGSDPGAVSKIKESDYTLSYGLELGKVLNSLGVEVSYSRTSDKTVSLSDRCRMANEWGADYFISLHFNSGGGVGIETFALSPGGKGEKLANAVQSAVIDSTGMVNRGVKFANFQVLRDTNMPAILIEGGFVDTTDADKIQTELYKQKFIRGVSKGVCAFLGLTWSDPYGVIKEEVKVSQNVTEQAEDKDIYLSVRVRTSKADALVEEIKQMGFACKKLDLA
jgi:N-acetylmuramoyl-L-alanine amidase